MGNQDESTTSHRAHQPFLWALLVCLSHLCVHTALTMITSRSIMRSSLVFFRLIFPQFLIILESNPVRETF